jgi:signal transduction histidine kinase
VIVDKLAEASRAVRDLAHGVYPPRLAEHGLEPALRAAAAAAALPTTVVATAVPRLTPAREAAVYFCCVEALRNAEKHAGEAAVVTILLEGTDGLHFVVEDSGKGCDPAVLRHRDGFVRMSDRVRAVGGTLQVFRSDSGGVRIVGAVGPSTRNGRMPGLAAAFLAAAWKAASRLLGVSGRTDYHNPLSAVLRAQLIPTVAAAFLVMVFGGVFRSGWLLVLGLLTLSAAATLLLGRRASEQGDTRRALLIAAPAIWIFSLLVVAIVPSALAQSLVQVVTPAVLAIPHIQRHFRRVVVWTVVVAVAIGAISRWSGGVGLESELPEWLVDTGIIATSVANSTVLLFAAYVNHLAQTTRTAQLRESTARVVDAADHVRRMIERDLHDGAQQRLIAASIQVRLLQRQAGGDSDTAQRLVDGVRDDLRNAAVELRDLTRGIYPADLAKHGLAAALRSVAGWSPLRTTVEAEGVGRHDSDIELNVYFFCLEALQNAVKHAGPDATVLIRLAGTEAGDLTFTVSDDGAGCEAETITAGHGFANIRDRVAALGGTVEVDARPGHGVRVGGQLSGARPRAT